MGDYTVVDETAYQAKWERVANYADEVLAMSGMKNYSALVPKDLYDGMPNRPNSFFAHLWDVIMVWSNGIIRLSILGMRRLRLRRIWLMLSRQKMDFP